MDRQELKVLLQEIVDKDCAVPEGTDPFVLSQTMLEYIGDTDSELRDDLILTVLMRFINQGVLTDEETTSLLRIAMDEEHLLKGLGRTDDTVFGRTFSAEVIAAAIYRHRRSRFLTEDLLRQAFHAVLLFYRNDIDVRGYVEGKGWAHGAAHGADVIDEFARCEEIGYEDLKEILDVVYHKVNVKHYGYMHYEEERIITAVKGVLERRLIPDSEITEWIHRFRDLDKTENYMQGMVLEINVLSFLKSLYFRLADIPEYGLFLEDIKGIIKSTNRFDKY